jgi:hypothetical protein
MVVIWIYSVTIVWFVEEPLIFLVLFKGTLSL